MFDDIGAELQIFFLRFSIVSWLEISLLHLTRNRQVIKDSAKLLRIPYLTSGYIIFQTMMKVDCKPQNLYNILNNKK